MGSWAGAAVRHWPWMAQVEEQQAAQPHAGVGSLCLCEGFARVTEAAALASARWLGRADQAAAQEAATAAMQSALGLMPVDGTIVLGAAEEGTTLTAGEHVGAGGRPVDLALDPLEGAGVVARGGSGAMAMVAIGDPGSFQTLPEMYMRKM